MFKGFLTQRTQKSKMSQEGEEEGNEVHLGLPCGRQKHYRAGVFLGHFFVNSGAKKLKKFLLNSALRRQGKIFVQFFRVFST